MATVELAASLPVLVVLLAVVLAGVSVVDARVRAQDAAGMAARAAARGDAAAARRLVAELAPRGAAVELGSDGDDCAVTVRVAVRPMGGWLGSFDIVERSVAAREPDAPS